MNNAAYTPDMVWEKLNIRPETLINTRVLEASIYLTRKCNLKCQYCKIIKTEVEEELSIDRWIEALGVMEGLGVKFVNIAGGEPTIIKGLGRLISYLNGTGMEYSIVSNSMFNDAKLREMVDAGLKAYIASVDVLGKNEQNLHDLKKASAGMRMLEKLKAEGVPYLCANIVISGTNIDNVLDVVRYLDENGIWINFCPIIWGKGDKWDKLEEADNNYRLTDSHRRQLEEICEELLRMKRNGAKIIPTESYIKGIPDHGVGLDWHCCSASFDDVPPRLTVDADGSMMTCINMRGNMGRRYSIFEMADPAVFDAFLADWKTDAERCSGCYWSTMVMARERQGMLKMYKEVLKNGTQG